MTHPWLVRWLATASAILVLVGGGCTPLQPVTAPQDSANPGSTAPTAAATATIVEEEATVSPAADPNSTPADQAIADLAERLAIEAAQIEVIQVQNVAWRDGSLGCPEPGMMYAQVVTPGTRIVLAVDGTEYYYHAGPNRPPFLCENPAEDATTGA
jgi:hypothetical protein